MSIQQKRVFRIEKYLKSAPVSADSLEWEDDLPAVVERPVQAAVVHPVSDFPWAEKHKEIMDTLKHMKEEIASLKKIQAETPPPEAAPPPRQQFANDDRIPPLSAEDVEDARKLRSELKDIYDAIEQTKVEILTIHQSGVNGMEISRVTDELGAIVGGTEKATETILEAAEGIDQAAADLAATLTDETMSGLASDIQDGVVKIFESCNFQDLTGQRISKVISAFRFIEERVIQMMEIWGGVDSFSEITTEIREDRKGDRALLNGPALAEDDNVASQDDIDALFD